MPVIQRIHCTECGHPVDPNATCQCGNPHGRARTRAAGYDTARWRMLVAAALERDGCCMDCGSTTDLTGGHLRYPALTADDVVTQCRPCNSSDGAQRSCGGFG